MSRKNREKRRNRAANPQKQHKQTVWEILKEFFAEPVDKKRTSSLSKFLGVVCLILAFCLLFYITGRMM